MVGMHEVIKRKYRLAALSCWVTLSVFLTFGIGSNILYARDFLPVALGFESKEVFLRRMASDYPMSAFINQKLGDSNDRVMIFYRHMYYLRSPFINGNPDTSWVMHPERHSDSAELYQLLRELDVQYVLRAPDYPSVLVEAFKELEQNGQLYVVDKTTVSTIYGMRIDGLTSEREIVLLKLADVP
jgi:hypothetical protein